MSPRTAWTAAGVLVAALVVGVVVLIGRGISDAPKLSSQPWTGRPVIHVAPASNVGGTFALPAGTDPTKVQWQLRTSKGVLASGTGTAYLFKAPATGSAQLVATAGSATSATNVVVTADNLAVGTRLHATTGTVLVNGGPAVEGEVLVDGDKVDASAGTVEYLARVAATGTARGKLTMTGAKFTVSATATGGQVTNHLKLDRAATTQKLVADVQHVDGSRYVDVTTPDAVALVKGTHFIVTLSPTDTQVAVDNGWVVVQDRRAGTNGAAYDVRTGQSITVPSTGTQPATVQGGQSAPSTSEDAPPPQVNL